MKSSQASNLSDPLSDVFSLLDVRSARCTRLEAGGSWSLHFPAQVALKFAAVLRGWCWLVLPGEAPHRLEAGDTFLLANAPGYRIANDLAKEPDDGVPLFDEGQSVIARHQGDDTVLIGGRFIFDGRNVQLLLDALPSFMHVPATTPAAAVLRQTLLILDAELEAQQIGVSLMTRRLADILLVQVLRAYISENGAASAGWVGALTDRKIGDALNLMHHDPGHNWTVGELSSSAGMSRSAFALRFKQLVGVAPLTYLLRWRMQRARDALRRNEDSVATIAVNLGYSSESAFGNAFKRVFGRAPKRYWSQEWAANRRVQ
jgi:AraC-like DNA-binding protein